MRGRDEIEGLRVLSGEASGDERRAFAERLDREPELRAAFARRRAAWEALDLSPVAAPPGFAGRVLSRAREEALRGAPGPSLAWRRAAAVLALAAGAAAGAGLGTLADAVTPVESGLEVWQDESMAASYLEAVDLAPEGSTDASAAGTVAP